MEKDRGFPLSIFAWFGYALPLAESLGKIRAAGFDAVLLWWSDGLDGLSRIDQAALARRNGLEVENAHAPYDRCNDLWLPGEERARAAARELIACVEDCAAAEVKTLVVHLTDGAAPPPCSPLGPLRLRPVVETGRPAGIRKSAPSAAFEAGTRYLRQPGRRSMLRQRPPSWVGPGNGLALRIRVQAVCPPPPRQRRDTGQPRRPF